MAPCSCLPWPCHLVYIGWKSALAFPGGPMECLSLLLAFDQNGVSIYFLPFRLSLYHRVRQIKNRLASALVMTKRSIKEGRD